MAEETVTETETPEEITVSVPVPEPIMEETPEVVVINPEPVPEPENKTVVVHDERGAEEHALMHEEHERRHNEFEEHLTTRIDEVDQKHRGHSHDDLLERIVNIEETLKPDEPEKKETAAQSTNEPTIIEPDVPKLRKPEQKHFLRRLGF